MTEAEIPGVCLGDIERTPPYVERCEWSYQKYTRAEFWHLTLWIVTSLTPTGRRRVKRMYFSISKGGTRTYSTHLHYSVELPGYRYPNKPAIEFRHYSEAKKFCEDQARLELLKYDLRLEDAWSEYPQWFTTSEGPKSLAHLYRSPEKPVCGRSLHSWKKPVSEEHRKCPKCLKIATGGVGK